MQGRNQTFKRADQICAMGGGEHYLNLWMGMGGMYM